ncbi:inositol-pentakisphosphate 2-kinase [Colletotrichum karsti]|uniref:Inositol-pentakisphosphate 2-kinase n=1 Tax=Colletotrichum karsti TaxID=1095194 RepID=A0A9P6HZ07_9PEZI|nr:inositol-pentakisphosphate 2-kinase [Colletotrichum karsti]KAF9872737.1 inositol-pentakisphosphate 2-kinase [Colletotrichum karsti]
MAQPLPKRPSHQSEKAVVDASVHIGPWTHVEYVGEGAANVVFETRQAPSNKKTAELDRTRYLLRVPKKPKDPAKRLHDAWYQYNYIRGKVFPLFDNKDDLFAKFTVAKVSQDTIVGMRNHLKAMDEAKRRPAKFVGDTVDCGRETVIMLVEDMRPRPGLRQHLIEIKPKWLIQSPSAPEDANTCRCCALAAKKFHDSNTPKGSKIKDQKYSPDDYSCPLWLDPLRVTPSDKEQIRREAIKRLFKNDKNHTDVYERLKRLPTLTMLRKNQLSADSRGPLRQKKDDPGFSMAMTLRDCSLFIRYQEGEKGGVVEGSFEARLADLDCKNAEWKFEEWQAKERALVDEGWYTGRGQMKNCALYRPLSQAKR